MIKYLRYIVFCLGFYTIFLFNANAGVTEKMLLDSLDLTELNQNQQIIFRQELQSYAFYLDDLAKSDTAQWKKKVKEMLYKIRDGFKIYKIARNDEIKQTISDFEKATDTKVYIFTYLQDAFLNNIFYRLAEAFYETTRPLSYVIVKFSYSKGPSYNPEKPSYLLKSDTVKMSEQVRNSVDSKLSLANMVARVNTTEINSDAQLELESVSNVKTITDKLRNAGIKGTNISGIYENMVFAEDAANTKIEAVGNTRQTIYLSKSCEYFSFNVDGISDITFDGNYLHGFKYDGKEYSAFYVIDKNTRKRSTTTRFLPIKYFKEQYKNNEKAVGYSVIKNSDNSLTFKISDHTFYFTQVKVYDCSNSNLKDFQAGSKLIPISDYADCKKYISECQSPGKGNGASNSTELVVVNKTSQTIDLSTVKDLLNGQKKITDSKLGELQTSKVCLFLSDEDNDFTQKFIDDYKAPEGAKKLWLHYGNGTWKLKGGIDFTSLNTLVKNKMGGNSGFGLIEFNSALSEQNYSLTDLATATYLLSDWLVKATSTLYIPESWWNCNSAVYHPPVFVNVVKSILSPVSMLCASSGLDWFGDDNFLSIHGLSYTTHIFALQVGVWDGFVGLLAVTPTLIQLASMNFTDRPDAVKYKTLFTQKIDQNGGGMAGFANMVIVQLKNDFSPDNKCVLAHSVGQLGFDVLTIVFTAGTASSASTVGKVVKSTFQFMERLDVVSNAIGKVAGATMKVAYKGTSKVFVFSVNKTSKVIEATLAQGKYIIKVIDATTEAFKNIDWAKSVTVSAITPDGKAITVRIYNPVEEIKNVKYNIKQILKDSEGLEIKNNEGEYAAIVSENGGSDKLVVVKEGGDLVKTNRSLNELAPNGRIPKNEQFNKWFDDLNQDELNTVWNNEKVRKQIEAEIRKPGGLHEWCMVCEVQQFKSWGVKMTEIKEFRTKTTSLKGTNPVTGEPFAHSIINNNGVIVPGPGSKTFHNELQNLISSSRNLKEFNEKLITLIERWKIDPKLLPPFIEH